MSETRFTKDHEWVRLEGDVATVGITDHAQEALGEIVFIELPDAGRAVEGGEAVAVAESTKAASDVYAPLPGTVTESNQAIVDKPGGVNEAAEGAGWFFKLKLADRAAFDALLDEAAYKAFLETL